MQRAVVVIAKDGKVLHRIQHKTLTSGQFAVLKIAAVERNLSLSMETNDDDDDFSYNELLKLVRSL